MHMYWSEDSFVELVVFFHKDCTQASRFVGKYLYHLCHLIIHSPLFFFESVSLCSLYWSQTHDCPPSDGKRWGYRHVPHHTQPQIMFLRLRHLDLLVWTHSPPLLWKNTKNRTGSELIRVLGGNRWSTQKDTLEKELFKDMCEGLRTDIKGCQIATDYHQWAVISVLWPEGTKDRYLNPLCHVAIEGDQ